MSQPPFEYRTVDMTDEEFAEEQAVYGGLTQALRRLGEVSLRTTVGPAIIEEATKKVDELTELLGAEMIPGNFGVVVTTSGHVRGYGNSVVGIRNPIAPPLRIVQDRVK